MSEQRASSCYPYIHGKKMPKDCQYWKGFEADEVTADRGERK